MGKLFSIPWGHHRDIIDKCKNVDEALFYVEKTFENNWSRDVLLTFISTDLYQREGNAVTNFDVQLPKLDNDLVKQITRDPYNFVPENYKSSLPTIEEIENELKK